MSGYDRCQALCIRRHPDGVVEIVMAGKPGHKLPTADARTGR